MELYLIRHADAAPLGEGGITKDEDRPLTPKGEEQARRLASGLSGKGSVDVVLTSPLLRARQTAEGMLQAWPRPSPELRVCEELAPGGKRRKLSRFVRQLGFNRLALVGHQPDLDTFAAWLIGKTKAQIEIAKAGVAFIRCEEGPNKGDGTLLWLVTPEWFS